MEALSERNIALLIHGGKTTGSMVEGYYCVEEQLYIDEAHELFDFCEWIDKEVGGCSTYNIEWLFTAFKNPNDPQLQKRVKELKNLIASFKV